jgi:tetratricopeptide (TPR) repeat protein
MDRPWRSSLPRLDLRTIRLFIQRKVPGFVDITIPRCRIFSIVSLTTLAFPRLFRFKLRPALTFLAVTLCVSMVVVAQSEPSATDPQVQKIYGEAKAAEARGDLASAAASYESLLEVAPHLGPAYNNLGALYLRQKEYKKAADVLEKGLKIDPKMSSASALLGISLYELGEYAGARHPLEMALRANPKDDNAEFFLANDLIKLSDWESAAGCLHQLAERQPKNQEIWYLLGKVHMKLSEQALAKLSEIDANSQWTHEISGEVMESMKNFDGALIEYKKAVEIAPRQPGFHYALANAYWSLQSWDAATQQFREELGIDPSNCMAQWKLGNIVLEQHEDAGVALAEVEKALALCPNLVQARVDRARALLKLERNEDARKDLLVAEQTNPEEPSIHFLLAQTYRALGRINEAKAEMGIFSKLEESNRAAVAERAKQVIQNKENATPQN